MSASDDAKRHIAEREAKMLAELERDIWLEFPDRDRDEAMRPLEHLVPVAILFAVVLFAAIGVVVWVASLHIPEGY